MEKISAVHKIVNTVSIRFRKVGIPHPVLEAKKYLLTQQ